MTNEEMERAIQFIITQQAQFTADIQQIKEIQAQSVSDIQQLRAAETTLMTAMSTVLNLQSQTDTRVSRLETELDARVSRLETAVAEVAERVSAFIKALGDGRRRGRQS